MRYLGILSLAALLAALPMGCGQRDTPFSAPEAGGSVSATEVGKLLPRPEPDGRWTVIYYWAIWCAPCRVEIPKLNVFADEMADSTAVYGVNYDNPAPAEHLAQAAELGIAFPMLAEDPAGHLKLRQTHRAANHHDHRPGRRGAGAADRPPDSEKTARGHARGYRIRGEVASTSMLAITAPLRVISPSRTL